MYNLVVAIAAIWAGRFTLTRQLFMAIYGKFNHSPYVEGSLITETPNKEEQSKPGETDMRI